MGKGKENASGGKAKEAGEEATTAERKHIEEGKGSTENRNWNAGKKDEGERESVCVCLER